MKQRGRKSAAETATVTNIAERPAPPEDLNEFQQNLWRDVVDTKPVEWFRKDTFELLRSYCVHCWHARELDKRIADAFQGGEAKALDDLLRARERESRAILAAARSMRITQQAQYEAKTAARHNSPVSKRPWER